MPLILGTNSIKDTGYDVDNSLRFDDGSSDYLSRTNSSATSTYTFSAWIKLSDPSPNGNQWIFSSNDSGLIFRDKNSSQEGEQFVFYNNANTTSYYSGAKRRDISSWYHVVLSSNSGTGTLYVNGVSDKGSIVVPTLSTSSNAFNIGRLASASSQYFSGYMAEVVFIDGQSLDPTSFGEFDEDSGIWKPIDVSGLTFGTNGFYLDFENSGSLGADVSGNGNNFTVNNLTAIDQTTDTCTNNFATLNPLEAEDNSPTYSDGNLTQTTPTTGGSGGRSSIEIPHTGVWYWEVKIVSVTGTVGDNIRLGISTDSPSSNDGQSIKYMSNGQSVIPGSASSYGATYTAGDIIGIKVDADNNQVTFYKNGASQGAISYTMVAGETYKAVVGEFSNTIGCVYSINFGNPPFTISSGNTDANGYGNFEYSTDSGYALNTKNLAEYG